MTDDIIKHLLPFVHDEMRMPAGLVKTVIEEIERLTEWQKNALLALDKREAEIGRLREDRDRWHDMADNLARFGNCESPDCLDCDRDWKLIYQDYEKAVRGE